MKPYRNLHPTKEGKRIYRFILTENVTANLLGDLSKHPDCDLIDGKGVTRAVIRDGKMTIFSGYAWNGCSPKHYIGYPPFGIWVGTPDFEGCLIPSLVHDVLYQFAEVGRYTFSQSNLQFLFMMEDMEFSLAKVYYDAVDSMGGQFWGKDKSGVTANYIINYENNNLSTNPSVA